MAFSDWLRDVLAAPYLAQSSRGVPAWESPWASPNHLVQAHAPDGAPLQVTRALAMSVPAVARARRLIVGSIARCPIEARAAGERLDPQPVWISRTDGVQSPFFRMTWTIDDLLFHGWSCWSVDRDTMGRVIRASRIPFDLWDFTETGGVRVRGTEVSDSEVCVIPGMDEGLLSYGAEAIEHAADLNRQAARAAKNPHAQILLKDTGSQPLTDPEIKSLIDSWAEARRGRNGGVAYANSSIEVKELGEAKTELLVGGRAVAAIDIARAAGVPSLMIDAAPAGTGGTTYANQSARNLELVDYALSPHMAAVAARLGLDDMVPRGTAIAFDLTDLTSPTVGDLDVPDDDQTAPAAPPSSIQREGVTK